MKSLSFIPNLHLVGGAVRDILMGNPPKDYDFASPLSPTELIKLCEKEGYKTYPTGIKHGTITVATHEGLFEVTTFRQELVCDGRHARVSWVNDIEQDLSRRDFTLNAMAIRCEDETLIDPFGGEADIDRGLIRAVGNPNDRLKEDYLRVIRAARFSARFGFAVEGELFKALRKASSLVNQFVAQERVTEEFEKAMVNKKSFIDFVTLLNDILFPVKFLGSIKGQHRIAYWDSLIPVGREKSFAKEWKLSNKTLTEVMEFRKFLSLIGGDNYSWFLFDRSLVATRLEQLESIACIYLSNFLKRRIREELWDTGDSLIKEGFSGPSLGKELAQRNKQQMNRT